jgi:hypothetical protein
MIGSLLRQVKLYLNPPKKGDVYLGDPLRFVIAKPMEYILHGLKDKTGKTLWEPLPSEDCYKITIENDSMPDYYICQSEVLCLSEAMSVMQWHKRTQPKRIGKELFNSMIINGTLGKG